MTHQVGPKQRKGNDKERIQTKYPFAKPVIRHQRRGLQWRKLGLPASALMFKKPWRTSVTMNNSQRRRAPLPLYLQTRRVLILHVTRVLMYTSTVTAKEFIDIDIRGFLTKFWERHVNHPKLRRGNILKFRRGTLRPPPPPLTGPHEWRGKTYEKNPPSTWKLKYVRNFGEQ